MRAVMVTMARRGGEGGALSDAGTRLALKKAGGDRFRIPGICPRQY